MGTDESRAVYGRVAALETTLGDLEVALRLMRRDLEEVKRQTRRGEARRAGAASRPGRTASRPKLAGLFGGLEVVGESGPEPPGYQVEGPVGRERVASAGGGMTAPLPAGAAPATPSPNSVVNAAQDALPLLPLTTMDELLVSEGAAPRQMGERTGMRQSQTWRGTAAIEEMVGPWPSFSFDFLRSGEFWLNKVGIGLLLLGLAFLFKYSIDRGWLTEWARIVFGILLGTTLLATGLRLYGRMRHLSQVLLGGGIASYYITGFAAYQLFRLWLFEDSFLFMAAATALAFILAIRQNQATLALIGAIGGLATPFLLYSDNRNLPGLVLYASVLLAGTAAIYFYKGWRSLLWTSFCGGWAVLALAVAGSPHALLTPADKWALQAGVVVCGLLFWVVPLARDVYRPAEPAERRDSVAGRLDDYFYRDLADAKRMHAHLLTLLNPPLAIGFLFAIWAMPQATAGWIVLGASPLFWLAFARLREYNPGLAYTQAAMGLMLGTFGLVMVLQGEALLFALAAEATMLHLVARRVRDRGSTIAGHALYMVVGLWLAYWHLARISISYDLNSWELTHLAVIALGLITATQLSRRRVRRIYLFGFELALAAWLWHVLLDFPNGAIGILTAWAAFATLLHYLAKHWLGGDDATTSNAAAHVVFGLVCLWYVEHLLLTAPFGPLLFNLTSLGGLAAIALALGSARLLHDRPAAGIVYHAGVYAAFTAWLWHDLQRLPDGSAYSMLAWAAFGALLHVLARRMTEPGLSLVTSLAGHAVFWLAALTFVSQYLPKLGQSGVAVFNVHGLAALLAIGLMLAASTTLRRFKVEPLVYQYLVHAAVLGWLWHELARLPDGEHYVFLAWAVYATLLHLLADRAERPRVGPATRLAGHIVFSVLGGVFLYQCSASYELQHLPVLNAQGLTQLAVIGLAALAGLRQVSELETRTYLLAAHGAALVWLWSELASHPDGIALITVAWGAYAVLVLMAGVMHRRDRLLLNTGLATLALVAGKLIMVDMTGVDALWRILLFMGFGGLFLLLSYYLQRVLQPAG